ncbi:uncharacterized protein LOC125825297 [Solanum verrucosum]|uniref:uncharacterized protein LOC125825297 n=1 Tax=Solanum verrucosum TaxID=315347 RepID=UPI0020D1C82A|nr:uncharacterized protein LOC125825297 [Solanum verrucosum]
MDGLYREDITDDRWQKIDYDNIPDYCFYCKHQGHLENECTIRQRDEDRKKKDMEAVRNKNNKEMEHNTQTKDQKEGDQKEGTNQQYNQQRDQEQIQHQQEEHWQTQKKRNNNQPLATQGNESSPSLEVLDKFKGNISDSRLHTAATK